MSIIDAPTLDHFEIATLLQLKSRLYWGRSSQSLSPTTCKLKDHLQYKGGHSGVDSSYHVHQFMLDKTRESNQKAMYISILHDEVTTLDQQPWMSIYCYVMQEKSRGGGGFMCCWSSNTW